MTKSQAEELNGKEVTLRALRGTPRRERTGTVVSVRSEWLILKLSDGKRISLRIDCWDPVQ